MKDINKKFKQYFKFDISKEIIEFFEENQFKSFPITYKFPNEKFILEIQYLLDIKDPQNYDVDRNLLSFAINTDGYELLIDLKTSNLEILQKEF